MLSYMDDSAGAYAASSYAAAEEYILGIPKFTKKNDMECTRRFLKHMGSPEDKIKTIHIAGTNGKGSVCAYLHSILAEAGISAGVFTSPHLVTVRERFAINGELVSEDEFVWAFNLVADKLRGIREELRDISYHPSFFEYLFFMAMAIFERHGVEYMILETGLGGRLDATNAIDDKKVCVITSIGYDHMEYLGETLPEIAAEKAGIFRPNVPAVFWDKEGDAAAKLKERAAQAGALVCPVLPNAIKEINSVNKTIDFSLQSNYYGYIRFNMPTIALYQTENAALAVMAIEQLADRGRISAAHLVEGIKKTRWEGRMEEISPSVWLDGAHNIDGIRAFLKSVERDGCKDKRRLLFSMVKDKQYRRVMDLLAASGLFEAVGIVEMHDKRALPIHEMADYFRQYTELRTQVYDSLEWALHDYAARRGDGDRLYIVGSLYLAGEVKALLRRSSHD